MMRFSVMLIIFPFIFQSVVSYNFLRELISPRNPVLHRTRRLDSSRKMGEFGILDFVGLVESYGYPAEEHYLTTQDGYKLVIHRIPGSAISPPKIGKPVILLQHGVLGSSDSWVLMGAKKDLAFILVDKGYDVWAGNMRGNSYCRSHATLSTADAKFWNFSYHEIGFYDLPAVIDYTLGKTGQKDLTYIGHSMGTTVNFVLLSTKPEYNDKVKLSINLAPIALWEVLPSDFLWDMLISYADIIEMFLRDLDIHEIFPQTDDNIETAVGICGAHSIANSFCAASVFALAGSSPEQLDTTLLPKMLSYFPAGGSLKTIIHYIQNLKHGTFKEYDYGCTRNYKVYGSRESPSYNLTKITAPMVLIHSTNDPLVRLENVIVLSKKLQNLIKIYEVPHKEFNHLDYIWARDARELLYNEILSILTME